MQNSGVLFHWLDVGQGSALLIAEEGHTILVDSGPPGAAEVLLAALHNLGRGRVDLWIHTHFDADHLGGVIRAVAGADGLAGSADDLVITELWDRGLEAAPATAVMAAYLARFAAERRAPSLGERWVRGGLAVEVVAVGDGGAENDRGLALRIDAGSLSLLVLGDLGAARGVLAAERAGPVKLLWASHHGARDGFAPALLELTRAEAVVISAGIDNSYCHPAPEVLGWLQGLRVWILGAAGIAADGRCPGIASSLGPDHHVLAEGLRLAAGDPIR